MQVFVNVGIICLVLSAHSFAQSAPKNSAPAFPDDLSKTVGFLKVQESALKRIRKRYPKLAREVSVAETEFAKMFGNALEMAEAKLKRKMRDRFAVFDKQVADALDEMAKEPFEYDDAQHFISEVKDRAKGKVPSPVWEILLANRYEDNPVGEFNGGFTKGYRSLGHPKSKALDFQIRYPASWKESEGERPNIVGKYVSENGGGTEMCIMMVKELPELEPFYKATEEDLAEVYSEEFLKKDFPPGVRFLSIERIVVDKQEACLFLMDYPMQKLGKKAILRMLNLILLYGNKAVWLQCSVVAEKTGELEAAYTRFEPLFRAILNSLVIKDQYK